MSISAGTVVAYPGVRWTHYTDSSTFFLPLAHVTYSECTQGRGAGALAE